MVIADRQLRKTTQRAVLADCDQHDSTVFGQCKLLNLQFVSLRATFRPKSGAQPDPFRFIRRKCCSYRHCSQTIQVINLKTERINPASWHADWRFALRAADVW